MAPLNLHLQDAANNPTQSVKGKRFPLLQAAAQLGINVISSSPLFQVKMAYITVSFIYMTFQNIGCIMFIICFLLHDCRGVLQEV